MDRRRTDRNFYQSMRDKHARRRTFHDFPRSCPVRGVDLADAGFYYTGEGDHVTCPLCRGSVVDWEEGDIPAEEHRRHFPQCSFVGDVSSDVTHSEDVADAVTRTQARLGDHSASRNVTQSSTSSAVNTSPTVRTNPTARLAPTRTPNLDIRQFEAHPNVQTRHTVEARDLRARMERPMAVKLVEMGFNFDTMKKVMMKRLVTKGEDFETAHDFALAVMDFEEEQERQKSGDADKCKCCRERKRDTMLLPCGHLVYCHVCVEQTNLLFCEECGTKIKGTNSVP